MKITHKHTHRIIRFFKCFCWVRSIHARIRFIHKFPNGMEQDEKNRSAAFRFDCTNHKHTFRLALATCHVSLLKIPNTIHFQFDKENLNGRMEKWKRSRRFIIIYILNSITLRSNVQNNQRNKQTSKYSDVNDSNNNNALAFNWRSFPISIATMNWLRLVKSEIVSRPIIVCSEKKST